MLLGIPFFHIVKTIAPLRFSHASLTHSGNLAIFFLHFCQTGSTESYGSGHRTMFQDSQTFHRTAPEQPDGIPLLCYNWTDGERFAITGIVIPFTESGELGTMHGSWIVLQNFEVATDSGSVAGQAAI